MTAALNFQSGAGQGPGALGSATNVSLNGTGIGIAWIEQAQTTDPITRFHFRVGARTGTPPSYVGAIETLDTSGKPSGTDIGGGSPTAKIFTPPASGAWDGTVQEITFTNPWTPASCGDKFAITIRYSSGTCDASNLLSFTRVYGNSMLDSVHFPANATLAAGAWTLQTTRGNIAWGTASTMYGRLILGGQTTATANTAGHRSGMYFTLPAGFGTTYQVDHVVITGKLGAAAGSTKVAIWDTSGTVMASHTIDADCSVSPASNRTTVIHFDTPATLNYGQKYYVGFEVISGTVYVHGITCNATDEVASMPLGANIGFSTFDGAAWTESAFTQPLIELGFKDITVPSGGAAGVLFHPGFTGGLGA